MRPGCDPSGATRYLKEHAIDQSIAIRYELGFVGDPLPGDERFAGMLSIPYLSPGGVQALKFRNVASTGGGKYAQHHGQKARLFNTLAYFEAGTTVGISEGEMDAIAATERLGIPTLGVPGATNWNELWTPLFKDFQKVLIFADGDDPGRGFALRIAEQIGWRARIVQCPDGEDVSSLACAGRLAEITTSNEEDE